MTVSFSCRQEVDRNLERIYVMEQRQFISMKLDLNERYPDGLATYVTAVKAFNAAFDAHQALEGQYSLDLSLQTRDNALALEEKHATLTERFLELKPFVLAARKALEI